MKQSNITSLPTTNRAMVVNDDLSFKQSKVNQKGGLAISMDQLIGGDVKKTLQERLNEESEMEDTRGREYFEKMEKLMAEKIRLAQD